MHFRKGYPIKRPWTFCPHLVQSFKVFGDLQWHWTFYPAPSKPSCHRDNLVKSKWLWTKCPQPLQERKGLRIQCVLEFSLCTYVQVLYARTQQKAKSSHIQDFGCSHFGNSQFSWLIQNSGCGSYRCVQFEHTYFGPIKRCAWRIFSVAIVRISYIRTQQKGQVYPIQRKFSIKIKGAASHRPPFSGSARES